MKKDSIRAERRELIKDRVNKDGKDRVRKDSKGKVRET